MRRLREGGGTTPRNPWGGEVLPEPPPLSPPPRRPPTLSSAAGLTTSFQFTLTSRCSISSTMAERGRRKPAEATASRRVEASKVVIASTRGSGTEIASRATRVVTTYAGWEKAAKTRGGPVS